MKVGDLVKFSKLHCEQPGIDYAKSWMGIVIEIILDSVGVTEELHIWWMMPGQVSDYPSSWWNELPYDPFEVISENQ